MYKRQNKELLRFFKKCIKLRKEHPVFRRHDFFTPENSADLTGWESDINWQSLQPETEDWSSDCHTLAFLLRGRGEDGRKDDDFFVMLNGDRSNSATFTIPPPPGRRKIWRQIIDTARKSPFDFPPPSRGAKRQAGDTVQVKAMAVSVLQSVNNLP